MKIPPLEGHCGRQLPFLGELLRNLPDLGHRVIARFMQDGASGIVDRDRRVDGTTIVEIEAERCGR